MRECTVCRHCFSDEVETCPRDARPTKPTLPIDPFFRRRYQLVKRLGRGRISVVYRAIDEQSRTECAIKIILPEYVGNNFKAGHGAFALRHKNIVAVIESGMSDNVLPFVVMDFIAGPSLEEVLERSGPLTPAAAFEYLKGIGNGLSFAHSSGVIHGDLKPRNIFLVDGLPPAEAIRIADFGLSAIKSGLLRSPLYLAPEEWSEGHSDARSDIYSVAVILYHMLTGAPPFTGKSNAAIMKSHLRDPIPSIAERFPDVTLKLEQVVLHALEKDPDRRPESVESFVDEFRKVLSSEAVTRPPDPPAAEQRSSTTIQSILLAVGVVLVITLISIGVYYSRLSQ
jgi:serine/threonine-protein kinase